MYFYVVRDKQRHFIHDIYLQLYEKAFKQGDNETLQFYGKSVINDTANKGIPGKL